MKPPTLTGLLLCLFLSGKIFTSAAQDKVNIKFGKISAQDFDLSSSKYDSGASAVVIADVGSSYFEGNSKGWFTLIFKRSKRIKVLNKNGFDATKVEISLYSDGSEVEKLQNLKASTYNLEGGNVVETKLDGNSVFTDKLSKNVVVKKFTFPAVKVGSVVEYSYTQQSDFIFNLQPWEFQGEYPVLWSEYNVSIPDFFSYVFLGQGYQPYAINTANSSRDHFNLTVRGGTQSDEHYSFDANTLEHRWVIKDLPALKEEAFTTTVENHLSRIEFQLSQYRFPNEPIEEKMGNWPMVSEKLMANDNFGGTITKNNGWLDDELKNITKGCTGKLDKAKKIYAYVRDNFTCTEHFRVYMTTPLKTVFKNKNGSETELNLMLAAMLNHEQVNADPVLLSTRSHGYTHQIYPLMDRFNYVVCAANIDNNVYYLDASRPMLAFGNLPGYCYNGHARVINKENPRPVYFEADSLKEMKMTSVIIINDDKNPGLMEGSFQSTPGNIESYDLREKIGKKGEKEFFKDIQSAYNTELEIKNPGIDSLKLVDYPVSMHYDFTIKHDDDAGIIYFNPLLSEAYKENPLKAAERKYPVEMPYASDEVYVLDMEIPKGYSVEEIPKSTKVSFNETDGFFEYLVAKDADKIQLRSRIKLNKANFLPEDYNSLREFFAYVVKKQSEQIVFKKLK